jgi:PmbA protein
MVNEKYISTIKDTCISIINSKIESVRNKNITKTTQRIYKDGYIGCAGAIGAFSENELLNEAEKALENKIEYPVEPCKNNVISHDMRKPIIPREDFFNECNILLDELTKKHPDFIFSNKINYTEISSSIHNNAGLQLDYADNSIACAVFFKEVTSANVIDGYVVFQERKFDRKKILEEFDIYLNAYKEKVDLPKAKRCPVLFANNMESCPIIKFLTDLHADTFATGSSIFSGKAGQKLFSDNFTFGQNLDIETVYNTPFFDAEGIVNPGFVFNLIENGIIKAPYCDKKTAHKYGLAPSGSSAAPYDGIPRSSLLKPRIKVTTQDLKSLLGGQMGIIAFIASGGDFTPQGDFGTPVQLAMLFDGEHILGRLPEFNISSNIFDMYGKDFRGVAPNNFLPFSTGTFVVTEMNILA